MEFLVGTYTRNTVSEGIYRVEFDEHTGVLREPVLALRADNPSFLVADERTLFVANEIGDAELGGEITVFDRSRQKLDLAQVVASHGKDPCHLALSDTHLAVANYSGGTVALFKREQSKLADDPKIIRHTKRGPHTRQKNPHPHGVYFIETSLWVTDLGGDCLEQYDLSGDHQATWETEAGAGPRHLSGDGRYLVNELNNTVHDRDDGRKVLCVPDGWEEDSIAAEIVATNGMVYVSNRGHDTIAVLNTTPALELVDYFDTGGAHPRHFVVTPEGQWLLVANKDTSNLTALPILTDGTLGEIADSVVCPSPTCILPI